MNYLYIQKLIDFEVREILYSFELHSRHSYIKDVPDYEKHSFFLSGRNLKSIYYRLELFPDIFIENIFLHEFCEGDDLIFNAIVVANIKGEKISYYIDTRDDKIADYLNLNEPPYSEHYKKSHGIGWSPEDAKEYLKSFYD